MSDTIALRGLRLLGTHGALAEEQGRRQPFELDLDLQTELGPSGRSDELAATIDYGLALEVVRAVVEEARFRLLEALAQAIADRLLATFPTLNAVTVAVRKLRPPVPVDLASAGVCITRGRGPDSGRRDGG